MSRGEIRYEEIATCLGLPKWYPGLCPPPTFARLMTRAYCDPCLNRRSEAQKRRWEREVVKAADSFRATTAKKRIREQRRAAGLCIVCGAEPAVADGATCTACRAAMAGYNRRRRSRDAEIERRLQAGESHSAIAAATGAKVATVARIAKAPRGVASLEEERRRRRRIARYQRAADARS